MTIVHVIKTTAAGVQCSTSSALLDPFWLPRKYVEWAEPPTAGRAVAAEIPDWLAGKHRQLVGDAEFEARKRTAQ